MVFIWGCRVKDDEIQDGILKPKECAGRRFLVSPARSSLVKSTDWISQRNCVITGMVRRCGPALFPWHAFGMNRLISSGVNCVGRTLGKIAEKESWASTIRRIQRKWLIGPVFGRRPPLKRAAYTWISNPTTSKSPRGGKANVLDFGVVNMCSLHYECPIPKNDKGIPILSMSCTENLTHALYPNYGEIAWNFMRHFARESTTGKLLYTPR